MIRTTKSLSFFALLLVTTACTQPAAQVDLRGSDYYGKDNLITTAKNYMDLAPAAGGYSSSGTFEPSSMTATTAKVESIGVSDLSAPSKAAPAKAAAVPASTSKNLAAFTPKAAATPAVKPAPVAQNKIESAPVAKPVAVAQNKTEAAPINKWTGKPREDAEDEMVQEEQQETIDAKPAMKVAEVKKIETAKEKPVQVAKAESKGFIWPVNGKKIISAYGPKGGGKINDGINIASSEGEPVWAAADGEIVYSGNELKGYGNMVLVKHNGGKTSSYAHLGRINVDKYDRVKQGDIIGYVGKSGSVKDPQLHFAIRDGKDPVDPMKYLSRNVAGL